MSQLIAARAAVDETDHLVETVGYGSPEHQVAKRREYQLRAELFTMAGFQEPYGADINRAGNLLARARKERNKRRKATTLVWLANGADARCEQILPSALS